MDALHYFSLTTLFFGLDSNIFPRFQNTMYLQCNIILFFTMCLEILDFFLVEGVTLRNFVQDYWGFLDRLPLWIRGFLGRLLLRLLGGGRCEGWACGLVVSRLTAMRTRHVQFFCARTLSCGVLNYNKYQSNLHT